LILILILMPTDPEAKRILGLHVEKVKDPSGEKARHRERYDP
jgi:hypothetical protein